MMKSVYSWMASGPPLVDASVRLWLRFDSLPFFGRGGYGKNHKRVVQGFQRIRLVCLFWTNHESRVTKWSLTLSIRTQRHYESC